MVYVPTNTPNWRFSDRLWAPPYDIQKEHTNLSDVIVAVFPWRNILRLQPAHQIAKFTFASSARVINSHFHGSFYFWGQKLKLHCQHRPKKNRFRVIVALNDGIFNRKLKFWNLRARGLNLRTTRVAFHFALDNNFTMQNFLATRVFRIALELNSQYEHFEPNFRNLIGRAPEASQKFRKNVFPTTPKPVPESRALFL